MKYLQNFALSSVVLCMLQASCSSTASNTETQPVSSTPLNGTIAGASFSAKGAVSLPFNANNISFAIFDHDVKCASVLSILSNSQDRYLSVIVPWPLTAGYTWASGRDVNGATASIIVGNATNAAQGRIEVVSASSTNAVLRVRAQADNGSVEGEVQVNVCP